jgi:uroporphyrinogen-III synthase
VPILNAFRAGQIQAVTAYSSETLDNLFVLLGDAGQDFLRTTPLFVPHARIAAHAKTLGIASVMACVTTEQQLIPCLVEYFAHV